MRKAITLIIALVLFSCKSDKQDNTKEKGQANSPSAEQAEKSPEIAQSISRGAKIYNNFCASCHLSSGEGIPSAFPPLNNSDWLTEKREESIHAIKFGVRGPIEVNGKDYDNLMPDLGLEDEEVADVMNYILNSWDNENGHPVSVEEVQEVEK